MRSVFVPVPLAEAKRAISMYDLSRFGTELVPIPVAGGCVIAIREAAREAKAGKRGLGLHWLDRIDRLRSELQVRSIIRTLAPLTGGDA